MQTLNVLHLSTKKYKGAGLAALEIHECLKEANIYSFFLSKELGFKGKILANLEYARKRLLPDKYWNIITGKNKKSYSSIYCLHSINDYKLSVSIDRILKKVPFKPDVIMIHWVSDFINAQAIKNLYEATGAKLFWTMMDNAPITGGCHYPWHCNKYKYSCGCCPGLKSTNPSDLTHHNLLQKSNMLKNVDISVIAFSQIDYARAFNSSVFLQKKKHKLFLPVDTNKYMPLLPKKQVNLGMSIPSNMKILLLGASNVQDERKGIRLFYAAWDSLLLTNTIILLIGKADQECVKRFNKNVLYMGPVNEEKLIKCYQAADFFVCPSLEDSGPYMINQALMCGTPVVAFNVGIAVDLIKTEVTGYNCGEPSAKSLAEGIRFMADLNPEQQQSMQSNCRQLAIEKLSRKRFASDFLSIVKD